MLATQLREQILSVDDLAARDLVYRFLELAYLVGGEVESTLLVGHEDRDGLTVLDATRRKLNTTIHHLAVEHPHGSMLTLDDSYGPPNGLVAEPPDGERSEAKPTGDLDPLSWTHDALDAHADARS